MATTDAMATTDLENGRDEATPPRQVPFARAEICEEARAASARVLESGWLTTGPEVVAFERELAEWVHADQEVADYARRARLHGMSRDAWKRYLPGSAWRYSVDIAGLKANMTDVQAAIGRAQLRHFAGWQDRRALLARRYDEALAGIPGLRPPARPGQGRHAWHLYVVQVEPEFGLGRDDLIAELGGQGVSCSVHFVPVHHFPYFQQLLGADLAGRHPGADAAFERVVSLPLYPGLALADVDYVCERIASLCRARAVLR